MENIGLKNGDILILKYSSIPEDQRTEFWKVELDFEKEIIILNKYKKGKLGIGSIEKISFNHWINLKNMKVPRYRGENKKNGRYDNALRYRPTNTQPFEIEGGENE